MNDASKITTAVIFIISALVLPFFGLLGGWAWFDLQRGGEMALIIFLYYLTLSGTFLLFIREPTRWMAALPYIAGVIYSVSIDPIPGGFDDALVMGVMSLLTFILWRKRQPSLSWWAFLPLLGVAAFELIGGFVPGPVDEVLAAAIGAGAAIAIGTLSKQSEHEGRLSPDGEFIVEDHQDLGDEEPSLVDSGTRGK